MQSRSVVPTDRKRPDALLVAATVLLITLTLRTPTAAVGPVVPLIGEDTGFAPPVLALLTSVPLLCFLVIAPLVPALQARLGLRSLVLWSLIIASIGTLIRSLPGTLPLAAGTVVLGLAVAVASVIGPAVIKGLGTPRRGWVVSLYTAGLSLGPAMAAGLTIPLGELFGQGWRAALGVWAILPFLAAVCWIVLAKRTSPVPLAGEAPTAETTPEPNAVRLRQVMRELSAWGVTAYLALTSLLFYSLVAWLPTMLESNGQSPASAGTTAALTSLVAIPASLLAPWMVQGLRARWIAPLLAPLPFALGAALLAVLPSAAASSATDTPSAITIVAVVMMGIGQGASVGVAYSLVLSTSGSESHATALSAMSQMVGVTLAAIGPIGLAAVQVAAGSWVPALWLLAALAAAQAILGAVVRRSRPARRRPTSPGV